MEGGTDYSVEADTDCSVEADTDCWAEADIGCLEGYCCMTAVTVAGMERDSGLVDHMMCSAGHMVCLADRTADFAEKVSAGNPGSGCTVNFVDCHKAAQTEKQVSELEVCTQQVEHHLCRVHFGQCVSIQRSVAAGVGHGLEDHR